MNRKKTSAIYNHEIIFRMFKKLLKFKKKIRNNVKKGQRR
jgi:hypothetical protein